MSGEKKFECSECEFISSTRESLRRHKKRDHLATYVPWDKVTKIPVNGKMARKKKNWWKFKCESCDYKTLSENLYKSHMQSNEHKAFAEVMLNYGKSAPERQEEVSTTKQEHVVTKSEPEISVKEFTCDECPYSTTWETEYMWHKESHNKKTEG